MCPLMSRPTFSNQLRKRHVASNLSDRVSRAWPAVSPSESARYAHIDHPRTTTELWEIPVFSPADGALILHMITYHYFFGAIIFPS